MASGDKRATNSEREAAKQLRPDLAIARILKRQVEKVVGPRDALVSIEIGQCHSLSSADFHLVRSRRTTLLSMGRRMAEMLERLTTVRSKMWPRNVRFGSLADIATALPNVRFTPESGHH